MLHVRAVADLIWPDACPGCDGPAGVQGGLLGGSLLCHDCAAVLPRLPRPLASPPGVAWAFGLGPYDGPLGAMVRRAKYRPDPFCCDELGRRLSAALAGRLPRVDAVVPVPVPARRRLRRGFDQAEILGRHLALGLGVPIAPLLRRQRPTEQAGRPHRDRRLAARGAFGVSGSAPAHVLLVDDVVTTGATASACADELVGAGAVRVGLVCVAAAQL